MSFLVTGPVLVPYSRADTRVQNTHILVSSLRSEALSKPSILLVTAFSTFPVCSTWLPRSENLVTSSSTCTLRCNLCLLSLLLVSSCEGFSLLSVDGHTLHALSSMPTHMQCILVRC